MKISVCIATYNGAKYIKEQLDSILCQIGEDAEVIVSDDGSTDKTLDIIRSYNDHRIKVFIHNSIENKFRGTYNKIYSVYKNVEHALLHASGDYIFLSDQDDIWLPNKISCMIREIKQGNECVLHNNRVIDNNYKILMDSYFDFVHPSQSIMRFISKCFYQGACMAFTKRIKFLSLPFPSEYPISHDHWIACIAWTHGKKISFIQEPLLLYRRHGNNVSPSAERSNNSLYFKISYRFNMITNYIKARLRK